MLLYNKNLQQLSQGEIAAFRTEVLNELENIEVPPFDELENDLSDYYIEADKLDKQQYGLESFSAPPVRIGGIFEKIREHICRFLSEGSTAQEIIDAILDAISSIIPGGIFFGWIVKKLIKYILNLGYHALCPVSL